MRRARIDAVINGRERGRPNENDHAICRSHASGYAPYHAYAYLGVPAYPQPSWSFRAAGNREYVHDYPRPAWPARASPVPILRECPCWSVGPPHAGARKPRDRRVANGCGTEKAFFQPGPRAGAASPSAPQRFRRIPLRDLAGMPHSAMSTAYPSSKIAPVAAPTVESRPTDSPTTVRAGHPAHPHPPCCRGLPLTTSGERAGRIQGRVDF